jgi:hypothetical protein
VVFTFFIFVPSVCRIHSYRNWCCRKQWWYLVRSPNVRNVPDRVF